MDDGINEQRNSTSEARLTAFNSCDISGSTLANIYETVLDVEQLLCIWATARQNQQNDVHPAKTRISLDICLVWSVFIVRSIGS